MVSKKLMNKTNLFSSRTTSPQEVDVISSRNEGLVGFPSEDQYNKDLESFNDMSFVGRRPDQSHVVLLIDNSLKK